MRYFLFIAYLLLFPVIGISMENLLKVSDPELYAFVFSIYGFLLCVFSCIVFINLDR